MQDVVHPQYHTTKSVENCQDGPAWYMAREVRSNSMEQTLGDSEEPKANRLDLTFWFTMLAQFVVMTRTG